MQYLNRSLFALSMLLILIVVISINFGLGLNLSLKTSSNSQKLNFIKTQSLQNNISNTSIQPTYQLINKTFTPYSITLSPTEKYQVIFRNNLYSLRVWYNRANEVEQILVFEMPERDTLHEKQTPPFATDSLAGVSRIIFEKWLEKFTRIEFGKNNINGWFFRAYFPDGHAYSEHNFGENFDDMLVSVSNLRHDHY